MTRYLNWRHFCAFAVLLFGRSILFESSDALAAEVQVLEAQPCTALTDIDFSHLQDAPTRIVAKAIQSEPTLPAHCEVEGYVSTNIRILMWLPVDWNGKFIEEGCGGTCGTLNHMVFCKEPLRRGYACIVTDMGHSNNIGAYLWAYNNLQGQVDFAFRATHVTALAGKAILKAYYGRAESKAYHVGCSTGGYQGLVAAQRFPWDFDGIVAGAPAQDYSDTYLRMIWSIGSLRDEEKTPIFDRESISLLHKGVVAKCDMNDGVKDGLIGNPNICKFDPGELSCKRGQNGGCLSQKQVDAARKLYAPPTTSYGQKLGQVAMPKGAELSVLGIYNFETQLPKYLAEWFRYIGFSPAAGPDWKIEDFDFDRDYKRFGVFDSILGATNPDLRKFRDRGGKLILDHGWSDGGASPDASIDYYETVEKIIGDRVKTQDFFRLFMLPGVDHCGGGEGAWEVDYLSYLDDWVSRGRAPDMIIAANPKQAADPDKPRFPLKPADVNFTRPVFPYPLQAHYKGFGNPNDASNFEPVQPR
jgi:hypothetical protein